jgi:hypothetical protein
VPIRHPITRKLQGVLNLTARYDDANHLMLPYAMLAAQEIEQQLYLHSSRSERLLLEQFLSAQKRSSRPFIALNDQIVISNPAAARVLDELGQAFLWEFAAQSIDGREQLSGSIQLGSGECVPTTCLPVFDGRATVGALIEIETPTRAVTQPRGLTITAKQTQPRGVWHDVAERARAFSARGLPLLVVGEEGVGKVALVREVFDVEYGSGEVTVLDARAQSVDGPSAWLKRFGRALGAEGGVVVVRHVEALDSSVARAACGLVDAYAEGPVRLVGTMTDDAATAAYQPFVDRFAVASVRIPPLRDRMQDLPALLVCLTAAWGRPSVGSCQRCGCGTASALSRSRRSSAS